jgi:uncharacterized protein (DUF608 family)
MSDTPSPHPEADSRSAPGASRREFLAASTGVLALPLLEGGAAEPVKSHHIPADKNLDPAWVERLSARGEIKVYRGEELTCIGMPIGGIGAGQLYLRGDGTLAGWEIFNVDHNTGFGDTCYRTYTPAAPVQQGFGVWVKEKDGEWLYRGLDRAGFPKVEFIGEYPIGRVSYRRADGDRLPLDVSLEAFSPFVPLNASDSGMPATIQRFRVRNASAQPISVLFGGWLQNTVCARHVGRIRGLGRNAIVRSPGLTTLLLSAEEKPSPPPAKINPREIFADFESGTYGDWKKTGTCFGDKPAAGTLPHQQKVSGFGGKFLVNTFLDGDQTTGTLTSPQFTIRRPYINFKIGGGNQPGQACINLVVDGAVARTATGKDNERLEADFWDVSDLQGKKAKIEIVDRATGGWGHINIDDIQFADEPPKDAPSRVLKDQSDFGTLALSVLDESATASPGGVEPFTKREKLEKDPKPATFPLGRNRAGVLATSFELPAGQTKEIVFLVTWHFAGGERGRAYGRRFRDAVEVARHLCQHLAELDEQTRLFHKTYYDSTLPHWLLDRLLMPLSTLATNTVQWWRNGRFWAWEGVGCCHGTCTHVWNYAQGVAYLFPELERSARTMQDLGPALDRKTGRVAFRGEGPGFDYAADGQCGTVLKCYREHLLSKDNGFLKEHWPRIKQVMEYAVRRDGNADGIIDDNQHNTYDIDFVGANTFVGALYLAALEAAARMAEAQGDRAFADRCRAVARKGSQWTVDNLWNGEYFVQRIPAGKPTKFQYGDGCLADQLFGQNWAHLLDLGYVYPADKVRTALRSVYRYNWAPDVAAQNKAHPPQRWFARPGEAGLFTCTWPKGGRMAEPVLYRDEIWTGIEYQVAAHMIREGMVREALTILRGVHDRYDGRKHNPWNEVECGDHYARALASWGCLLALAGYHYDGPAGRLGFAPRWQADDFQAFFSAAEGWGSLGQRRQERAQEDRIAVKHGQVRLRQLVVEVPAEAKDVRAHVTLGERELKAETSKDGARVTLTLAAPSVVSAGQTLTARLTW